MAYQTGFRTTLAKPLQASATEMVVAVAPTVTKGRLYLKSGSKEEWVSYDGVSGTTLQNLTRGLSKTADPATGGTGETWIAGTPVKLVAMHDQLIDKSETITISDLRFDGTTTGGLRIKSLTTTQRLALTPANGDIVYDSTLGENYQYIGGAWSAISSGSTQPNASTTTAGKVEEATDSEVTAGTSTGGTGAKLFATLAQLGKSILLKPTVTTTADTDFFVVNDGTIDNKITQENLRNQLAGGTTKKGTWEMASDAEATTGTSEVLVVNPKQAKSNYGGGLTINTYTATNTNTASQQVSGLGFACLGITYGTGNAPTNVTISIQTSPDNTTWTNGVSQTITESNGGGYSSLSLLIPNGIYVRGNVTGITGDTIDLTLQVQDNS